MATPASAQVGASALQDEAVNWLQTYLRVNTINPPGNEIAGVRFLKAILDAEGIPYETADRRRAAATSGLGSRAAHSRR